MRIHAPIGYYPQEREMGNDFIIDISVKKNLKNPHDDDIGNTINYEEIYKIVHDVMDNEMKLMETAAAEIGEKMMIKFMGVKEARVKIKKLTPIQGTKGGSSFVELSFPQDGY